MKDKVCFFRIRVQMIDKVSLFPMLVKLLEESILEISIHLGFKIKRLNTLIETSSWAKVKVITSRI